MPSTALLASAILLIPAATAPGDEAAVSGDKADAGVVVDVTKSDDPFNRDPDGASTSTGVDQNHSPRELFCASSDATALQCAYLDPLTGRPDAQPVRADDREGEIRSAVERIPLPGLDVTVQPAGETLVNVPTILYTQPQTVRRTVTLLGTAVTVEATPTTFTWTHGDGSSRRTGSPGRPYPDHDVTHTYQRAAKNVSINVTTSYDVRYRIDGGDWQSLDAPITAAGPATSIAVAERAPVLVN